MCVAKVSPGFLLLNPQFSSVVVSALLAGMMSHVRPDKVREIGIDVQRSGNIERHSRSDAVALSLLLSLLALRRTLDGRRVRWTCFRAVIRGKKRVASIAESFHGREGLERRSEGRGEAGLRGSGRVDAEWLAGFRVLCERDGTMRADSTGGDVAMPVTEDVAL